MATEDGRRHPSLRDLLFSEPQSFSFFQAVRLLRLMAGREADMSAAVRFRTLLSLDFPASEIHDLTPPNEEETPCPPEMMVAFMGLTGPLGVLPRHYTEKLIERSRRHRDDTAHEFLDLFNHRLITLFYEAWEKYHFVVAYERGDRETFTRYILDLVGLGTRGLQNRLRDGSRGVQDESLVYYGGLIAQRPHSAAALAAILRDYFGVEVQIEQCRGRWRTIPAADRSRLGQVKCALGDGVVLGERVWDRQSSLRVKLGPLSWSQFEQLLPDGAGFLALARFTRFFVGPSLDCDVQLVLNKDDVPACRVGSGADGSRLGWSTWLTSAPFVRDADEAVFAIKG